MATLEDETKPILGPMFRGEPSVLNADQQLLLSTSAVKTTMLLELVWPNRRSLIPPDHYRYVRDHERPTPTNQVWIRRRGIGRTKWGGYLSCRIEGEPMRCDERDNRLVLARRLAWEDLLQVNLEVICSTMTTATVMRKRRVMVGLAALALIGCASGSAADAVKPVTPVTPKPHTLLSGPGIGDFAQDRGSIAWTTSLGRKLHIRSRGRTATLRKNPYTSGPVLAGTRAVWTSHVDRSSTVWGELKLYTASLADPRRKRIPCCTYRLDLSGASQPLFAGSEGVLVYHSVRDKGSGDDATSGDSVTEYAIRRVMADGSTKKLFNTRPRSRPRYRVSRLDVNRGRIALAYQVKVGYDEYGEALFSPAVDVLSMDGSVISSFKLPDTGGHVIGLALDGPRLTVFWEALNRQRRAMIFEASSGRLQETVGIAAHTESFDAGGGWVVYTTAGDRVIRGFKTRDSVMRLKLRLKGKAYGLSVSGRRVAWVQGNRVRAFTLPGGA
jgi:hypothetical protein